LGFFTIIQEFISTPATAMVILSARLEPFVFEPSLGCQSIILEKYVDVTSYAPRRPRSPEEGLCNVLMPSSVVADFPKYLGTSERGRKLNHYTWL
jgi:hypothetical protein